MKGLKGAQATLRLSLSFSALHFVQALSNDVEQRFGDHPIFPRAFVDASPMRPIYLAYSVM